MRYKIGIRARILFFMSTRVNLNRLTDLREE